MDLPTKIRPDDPMECWHTVTPREKEVAILLARGESNAEIAKALGISVKTIETHRAKALDKMGAKNNVMLTRMLIRLGLVTP